ncbi:MAG: response regulator [Bdellovibrionota bacterium]
MTARPLFIIDSDQASNSLLSEVLAPQGFEVTTFLSGKDGLQSVLSTPPALVILCLELSDMSGYVACKKIKENAETAEVPIIILSRDATEKDFERHRKLKVAAQDYLKKPFENAELLRKIENLVGFNVPAGDMQSIEAKLDGLFEQHATDDEVKLKQKEIERLNREMEALRAELLKVKQQLSGGGGSSDAATKALQAERDQLAKKVQQLETGGGPSNAALEKQIAQLTRERDDLKSKFEFRENALRELNEFKLNADLKMQELASEAERARADLEQAQAESQQAQADMNRYAEEIGQWEARLNEYQTELQNQIEAYQQLEQRYQADLDQAREEMTHIESEAAQNLQQLQQREAELTQELEALREDYEKRLAETREAARRALEEGLAALAN